MSFYYAHTDVEGGLEHGQLLADHLEAVATQAEQFAAPIGAGAWARVIGLLHDAGKASEAFQRRLAGAPIQVDHSTGGAQLASKLYPRIGTMLSFPIAGHHGGMPNWSKSGRGTPLKERLCSLEVEPFEDAYCSQVELPTEMELCSPDALPACMPASSKSKDTSRDLREMAFGLYLTEQMLFSSLVDADYLDTEHFMQPEMGAARIGRRPSMEDLAHVLDAHMRVIGERSRGSATDAVNNVRAEVLERCVRAAASNPGLFTLEVPTGGGKTLASLSFALHHAVRNGQKRVIVAIPYTSIVEQTASTLKSIFGSENVLEHHSNYDYDHGDASRRQGEDGAVEHRAIQERLLVQNWDAPIVVTTNVQLFESLFSAKPSRCRKVHNIANAVIILDEAQMLPDGLLKPTLAMIQALADYARTTTVLCTATQPNLDERWPFPGRPTPIIEDDAELFKPLNGRVRYDCSRVGSQSCNLDELVDLIANHRQALCIVSTQDGARRVYEVVRSLSGCEEGTFHLSARMIPEHRSLIIACIKQRLHDGLDCRVVSTQLIEAGVDVDFPFVLREAAGIDSIIQAAGRCNRGGRLDHGDVVVFECPDIQTTRAMDGSDKKKSPTRNWLLQMRHIGLETIGGATAKGYDPFGREGVRRFFARRYDANRGFGTDPLDVHGILYDLVGREGIDGAAVRGKFSFEQYAGDYRFITDDGVPIFVPWGERGEALLARVEAKEVSSDLWCTLQRFSVSIPRWAFQNGYRDYIRPVGPYYVLETRTGSAGLYSEEVGLLKVGEAELDLLLV